MLIVLLILLPVIYSIAHFTTAERESEKERDAKPKESKRGKRGEICIFFFAHVHRMIVRAPIIYICCCLPVCSKTLSHIYPSIDLIPMFLHNSRLPLVPLFHNKFLLLCVSFSRYSIDPFKGRKE
jgi:hypothetical protein